MIALEAKEGKYDKASHGLRFAAIEEKWEAVLRILREELPDAAWLGTLLDDLGIDRQPVAVAGSSAAGEAPVWGSCGGNRPAGEYTDCTCHHLPMGNCRPELLRNREAIPASFAARMAFSSFAIRS